MLNSKADPPTLLPDSLLLLCAFLPLPQPLPCPFLSTSPELSPLFHSFLSAAFIFSPYPHFFSFLLSHYFLSSLSFFPSLSFPFCLSFCFSFLTLCQFLCLSVLPASVMLSVSILTQSHSTYGFIRDQKPRETHWKGSSQVASVGLLGHLQGVIYYRNTLRGHPTDNKLR